MFRTRVKVCGFRTPEEIDGLQEAHPDYAGFILVPGRRRTVTPRVAGTLIRRLPKGVRSVGVVMNPEREDLLRWWKDAPFDTVQLHGDEPPELCRWIKERMAVSVIKVFHVGEDVPQPAPEPYAPWIDVALLDSAHGRRRGGSGRPFSWERIPAFCRQMARTGCPVWVAGGLKPDNVGKLLEAYVPAGVGGVDISSGVETDGKKDPDKIQALVERVRRFDQKRKLVCKTNQIE